MPAYANAFLFGDHPYGNPVGGSESSLAAVTHKDLLAYYADGLGGDRLIIAVSGDFDLPTLREALTAAFGGWRAATGTPLDVAAPPLVDGNRVYLIDKPGATQSYFYIGNVGVARGYAGRAELDLANTVFGGRFTSMLVTELRTKSGLSYSARSILSRYSQPGSVFISSFTETSTTVAALDVALGTLGQLKDSGLDAAMLLSARNYVMGQFPPRLETAQQLAGVFASLEADGLDASYINDYGSSLAAATPASVAAVIEQVYPAREQAGVCHPRRCSTHPRAGRRLRPVTEISIFEAPLPPRYKVTIYGDSDLISAAPDIRSLSPYIGLFADAELGEYAAQELIRGDGARDFAEGLLTQAQLLGQQLSRPVFVKRLLACRKMCGRPA